jgi:hypothetical protein
MRAIVQSAIIAGEYYDLSNQLQLFLQPMMGPQSRLTDDKPREMAQNLHKGVHNDSIAQGSSTKEPPSEASVSERLVTKMRQSMHLLVEVLKDMVEEDRPRVTIAETVTEKLLTEVCSCVCSRHNLKVFHRRQEIDLAGHWSKTACPWLYSASDEERLVHFLNMVSLP